MIKLAVTGTGKLVQEILPVLTELTEIEVAVLCGTKRSENMVQKLCKEYEIPMGFTDYMEMLDSEELKDIDAVYLAVPNDLHYSMAKEALGAGVNVFLEKPFASNEREARELIELARKKRLYLTEAISNQYLPVYEKVRKLLSKLGRIRIVNCNFSQYSSRYDQFMEGECPRAFDPGHSGGALMDLNCYNLHFAAGLFGEPQEVLYHANVNRGADTSGVVHLIYPDFQCICTGAKDSDGPCELVIQGTGGYLLLKTKSNILEGPVYLHLNKNHKTEEIEIEEPKHRMIPEFLAYARMLEKKDYEQCLKRQEETLLVSRILDLARKSAGIHFPADDR
ncbi:MAG: Gfo/Idh/MocA family oxidoreductase [Lachnospiraceae bacterium]|nr:Gfo/Idh/MocA family oxidoreductase [Lachnospiraceae bacterium]